MWMIHSGNERVWLASFFPVAFLCPSAIFVVCALSVIDFYRNFYTFGNVSSCNCYRFFPNLYNLWSRNAKFFFPVNYFEIFTLEDSTLFVLIFQNLTIFSLKIFFQARSPALFFFEFFTIPSNYAPALVLCAGRSGAVHPDAISNTTPRPNLRRQSTIRRQSAESQHQCSAPGTVESEHSKSPGGNAIHWHRQ